MADVWAHPTLVRHKFLELLDRPPINRFELSPALIETRESPGFPQVLKFRPNLRDCRAGYADPEHEPENGRGLEPNDTIG